MRGYSGIGSEDGGGRGGGIGKEDNFPFFSVVQYHVHFTPEASSGVIFSLIEGVGDKCPSSRCGSKLAV